MSARFHWPILFFNFSNTCCVFKFILKARMHVTWNISRLSFLSSKFYPTQCNCKHLITISRPIIPPTDLCEKHTNEQNVFGGRFGIWNYLVRHKSITRVVVSIIKVSGNLTQQVFNTAFIVFTKFKCLSTFRVLKWWTSITRGRCLARLVVADQI